MKVDWNETLTDFDGQQVRDEEGQPVTLGRMAVRALMTVVREQIDGEEKFRRYKLAEKVHQSADLSVDEVSRLKKAVGEVLTPLAVGAIWTRLEEANAAKG